jgi:hypothetical protein
MAYGIPKGARERIRGIDIPAEMFTWKPDEDDIKGLMESLKVSKQEIAEALDIPLQRVTAAVTKPRKGTYMPNPHAQSTRTLIMLYLNSGLWRK